jgi:hypothetical protein
MSLHNLPLGAWERVVEHLGKHSFVAFAQTCTKFREEAYRYLYRSSFPRMETYRIYDPERFEEFMQASHSDPRQTLTREFHEGKSFHQCLSSEVTKTTHLILREPWLESGDEIDICSWIEAIHPESTFDILTVDIDGVEEGKVHALFQNLDKFNGLICLEVRGRFSQSTIDSIRCASLRQLDLNHSTFIPRIRSHASCPKLKTIRYLLPSRRPRIMNQDERREYDYHGRWDRLQQLMKASINFVLWQGPVHYMEPSLVPFILFYAEEMGLDSAPMMNWLIKSIFAWEGHFEVILGLERFLPAHRDTFIEFLGFMLPTILSTKIIMPQISMRLNLRSWDQVSLSATLPDGLHRLHITTSDHVNPELVTTIIRHQHDLNYLTVVMFLAESSDGTYLFESQAASCTHASPHPLPSISLPFSPFTDELWALTWWLRMREDGHYWYSGTEFRESFNKPQFIRRSDDILPEVVAEVRGWFKRNANFEEISLYFVGGRCIEDCFSRDMYWKDTGFVIFEDCT